MVQNDTTPSGSDTISLFAQIREDWVAHGRGLMMPGFKCIAVYRFGVWRMKLRPRLVRMPFSLLYKILYRHMLRGYGVELPFTAKLGRRVAIHHPGCIIIGADSVIGDDCWIYQGVTLGARHGNSEFAQPKIGRGVFIGAGAKILGGISIGDGAKIGANAVVLKDVPPGATAIGVPARIIMPEKKE